VEVDEEPPTSSHRR